MTSVCNEEDDISAETDQFGFPSLLCFVRCLNTDNHIMPNERENIIKQLSTRSAKHEPLLRHSIFKNHPPYINFYKTEKKGLCSGAIQLISNWFRVKAVNGEVFGANILRTNEYKTLTYWQKVNHFPGDFHIGRKDRLWEHLREMSKHFNVMFFQKDYNQLDTYLASTKKHVIIKPPASARGRGITIINKMDDIPTEEQVIAQHYVENPLLINGSKFDLRIYVYVSNLNPLLVYIYETGLVRFASLPYDSNNYNNQFMHLTNFSINKLAKKNGVTDVDISRLKWPLSTFWEFVREQGRDPTDLWKKIKDVAVKAVISTASAMLKQQATVCPFSFLNREVFGMDILIDDDFKPWILEMNISPSMQTVTEEDTKVKAPLVQNILNMWRMEFVHKNDVESVDLSYRCKPIELHKSAIHIKKETENLEFYAKTGKICPSILSNLTDADLRYLMDFEDEFALREDFELIYPATNTVAEYLPCTEPTYASLLLIAWISLSKSEREVGLERLKTAAEKGEHLSQEGFIEDDESVAEDQKLSNYASI
ncbi:hypothetical protein M3Y97_00868200 [Aphelenchoides bicaudatus]|nr:hypothetical protein M3Y97_00868200 [Aphelenchoides bicaudatus]